MYKSHAVGMNTLAKDTVTMKTTSRGKREKADSDKFGGMEAMMKVMMSKKKEYSKEEINFALAVMEVERTLKNVGNYKSALLESPERELTSMVNALNGGYTQPSPGAILSPILILYLRDEIFLLSMLKKLRRNLHGRKGNNWLTILSKCIVVVIMTLFPVK